MLTVYIYVNKRSIYKATYDVIDRSGGRRRGKSDLN